MFFSSITGSVKNTGLSWGKYQRQYGSFTGSNLTCSRIKSRTSFFPSSTTGLFARPHEAFSRVFFCGEALEIPLVLDDSSIFCFVLSSSNARPTGDTRSYLVDLFGPGAGEDEVVLLAG